MKKYTIAFLCALLALALCGAAMAETVYVTIADGQGQLVLINAAIEVSDTDADGALTINEALFAAHEAAYEGGAEAGYAAADMGYGLSISRLWGEENGGSYGYYLNDVSAYSLLDPVADGDYLNAFVYTDLETWSDTYCAFDCVAVEMEAGKEVELTLNMMTFDTEWNPVSLPVEGAILTIDGEDSEVVTDAEGKAQFTIEAAGEYLISARSDSAILVPPVCIVTVK